MANNLVCLLITVLGFLHAVQGVQHPKFATYTAHRSSVASLDKLWKAVAGNAEVLDQFIQTYKNKYLNTTQWLWREIVEEFDYDGLLTSVKQHYNFHYADVKKLFDDAVETFDKASRIELSMLKINNKPYLQIEKYHSMWRIQILQMIQISLDDLINSEWKPVAIADVKVQLQEHGNSVNVGSILTKFLQEKYPYRRWLVYIQLRSVDTQFCAGRSLYLLPAVMFLYKTHVAHVLHKDPIFRPQATDKILNRIPHKELVSPFACRNQADKIFEAMDTSCSTFLKNGLAAGVYPLSQNIQTVKASDPARLRSRHVIRKFWFWCKQEYIAFIFQ